MHFLWPCQPHWEAVLIAELGRVFPSGTAAYEQPGWVRSAAPQLDPVFPPSVAFARQCLPDVVDVVAPSVSAWAEKVVSEVARCLDAIADPWRLHVFSVPIRGGTAGVRRCRLIEAAIADRLQSHYRRLKRRRTATVDEPWRQREALVQVALLSATRGCISICPHDLRHTLRRVLSPFPGGIVRVPDDPTAPSRAYRKLLEAERHLGRAIAAGQTCLDLGSSPGGWAYLALRRGARVIAVDRSALRADLMRHPALQFVRGDAFRYAPPEPVDWLLSDLIAFPPRIIELLSRWLGSGWCRQFIATVKFRGRDDYPLLEQIKRLLHEQGVEFIIRRMGTNKNEVTAMGGTSTK
jgi:23S rRNA (cytidine2498-2'-O)-methyltransferase